VQSTAGGRGEAYKELCGLLGGLDAPEREELLDRVADWAGTDRRARADHRALTPDEVLALSKGGLVEIGGHTATHPRLSAMPLRAQFQEMREGKTCLESLLGRPVTSFSYPFGDAPDFTLGSMAMARLAGFRLSCAAYPGRVTRLSPTFALPRFIVRDWPGDEFERHLRAWLYD
jgi:peptidoglycan/xylan/chitin deacetylase (PgdA/CDA1 family)